MGVCDKERYLPRSNMLHIDVKVDKTLARRVGFENFIEFSAYHWFEVDFV